MGTHLRLHDALPISCNLRWRRSSQVRSKIFFLSVNMRNCGQSNVRKHREIKDSDERVTLNMNEILKISEKFDSLDKMETTSVARNYIFSLIWRCYSPKQYILDYWGTILYCLLSY